MESSASIELAKHILLLFGIILAVGSFLGIIANKLKAKQAVMINYDLVDDRTQQRINDFINGVCYVLNGAVQVISDKIVLYVPEHTEIGKELYAYSIPTYVKNG